MKASDFQRGEHGERWFRREGKMFALGAELPAGPWHDEPDRLEWSHAGFRCLMTRGPMGHWCGYVGVPPGHPWHGTDYRHIEASVHGGITYAHACQGNVCHVPPPGEPDDLWWVGFDCCHADDLSPVMLAIEQMDSFKEMNRPFAEILKDRWQPRYRPVPYVQAETSRLAEQAHVASASSG